MLPEFHTGKGPVDVAPCANLKHAGTYAHPAYTTYPVTPQSTPHTHTSKVQK